MIMKIVSIIFPANLLPAANEEFCSEAYGYVLDDRALGVRVEIA
jgi:hypothetical protein